MRMWTGFCEWRPAIVLCSGRVRLRYIACQRRANIVTDIIEGRTESTLRAIVENALKLLPPDCKDYQKLRHEAFARLELKVAEELAWVEEYDRMKFHLEQAMLEYPQLSREPMVRALVERLVSHMAFKSQSPIGVVKEITKQLDANARRNGLSAYFSMRSLTANIWKTTASDLSLAANHRQRSVVLVALRAVIANPFIIASPSLLKVFARQTVGTRAYIALALLIDRIF